MTVQTIMTELQSKGNEGIKKIFLKHGIKEPLFGVKVEHLKVIQKRIKKDYQLSKDLFSTGNADAMYLAGLIADENSMTKADLNNWVKKAVSNNISEYTVPWIAAESRFGFELALEWIESDKEYIAAAGWSTLSSVAAIKPDEDLDIPSFKKLLSRVEKNIHTSPDRIRSTMNGFIIATGTYITALTEFAVTTGKKIGEVTVLKEGTACKVPDARTYILKNKEKGKLGKKKKMARC